MLKKNVYLIYPAGYSGSYLKWALEISDRDIRPTMPLDPLNRSNNNQFGGVGTAHCFTKIPTHQGFRSHFNWMIYNRPSAPNIYLINPGRGRKSDQTGTYHCNIADLLLQDPTGIIINIHDNNDRSIASYGRINCVTKWPTFISSTEYMTAADKTTSVFHEEFNPFDCQHDIKFRNLIARRDYLGSNGILNQALVRESIDQWLRWYTARNLYQSHEVNERTYPTSIDYSRLFEISCLDIATGKFPELLQDILDQSGISDHHDRGDYVREFHENYIRAQPNLQWFTSLEYWRSTGKLDGYLQSHSIIEAELIREMFWNLNIREIDIKRNDVWRGFYCNIKDPSWPDCEYEHDFYRLSPGIQEEILQEFKYTPDIPWANVSLLDSPWENMSLSAINDLYQSIKYPSIG